MSETRTYLVEGMSCEHCRSAVIDEVSGLSGVETVEVDLASGRIELRGEVDDEALEAAVEKAGYALASTR